MSAPSYERQQQLDALEDARDERLCGMGRALLEWSGIDPTDADAIGRFKEAVGWSSIPDACGEIAGSLEDDADAGEEDQ